MRCRSAPSRKPTPTTRGRACSRSWRRCGSCGLVGPPVGALVASTIRWRWAFVVPLPVLAVAVGSSPRCSTSSALRRSGPGLSLRWPVSSLVGAGFVFASLTVVAWWVPVAVLAGLAISLPRSDIAPPGTFTARPGLPATAAGAFLLSTSFLAMDAFLTPTVLTRLGCRSGPPASSITVASITWAAGALWQSYRAGHRPLSQLVAIGTVLLLTGQAAVASTLWIQVPLFVAYVGWGVVGLGMGIAFATIPLAAMRSRPPARARSSRRCCC